MKSIKGILTEDRKRIPVNSFFSKERKESANRSVIQKFKHNILAEPYGTIVIMDAIELAFSRSVNNWCFNRLLTENEHLLIPKYVEMMMILGPQATTNGKYILKAFERLLNLQVISIFDDYSYHNLIRNTPTAESSLALLSHFKLEYVGAIFVEPMNQFLAFFIQNLTERGLSMSKNMLDIFMKSYFEASLSHDSLIQNNNVDLDNTQIVVSQAIQKLTLARVAYFLFTIKAQRGLNLVLLDYRAMLNFYQCYLTTEVFRFKKDNPHYYIQNKVGLNLIESLMSAIEQLPITPELKIEIIQSKEYCELSNFHNIMQHEVDEKNGYEYPSNSI